MFHEEPFTSNKKVQFFTESFFGEPKMVIFLASQLKPLEPLFQCIKCIETLCALKMFSYCALAH